MKSTLEKLISGINLCQTESYDLFSKLMQAPIEQQAAVLALFAAKGESIEELLGAREFLFEQRTSVDFEFDVIDIVGTGGDNKGTFNISTAASLVIASCGVYVAKHGGRSTTSQCGSTDLLENLEFSLATTPIEVKQSLEKHHYAYLSAPLFNPVFKAFSTVRKNLGFPTLFNFLGPLLNPINPKKQVIGVSRKALLATVAKVLQQLGSQHAMVLHSEDGLDELSMSAPTTIVELKNNKIKEYQIVPTQAGLPMCALDEVLGGTPSKNAEIIKGIFTNKIRGPKLDIVLLNSAAGLIVADKAKDFREGVEIARDAIESGKAFALLHKLRLPALNPSQSGLEVKKNKHFYNFRKLLKHLGGYKDE